jgi:hypothetical protein
LDILWKSAIPPENGSDENLMQGLMNRQQAPARLMRESHHVAVAYGIIRPTSTSFGGWMERLKRMTR